MDGKTGDRKSHWTVPLKAKFALKYTEFVKIYGQNNETLKQIPISTLHPDNTVTGTEPKIIQRKSHHKNNAYVAHAKFLFYWKLTYNYKKYQYTPSLFYLFILTVRHKQKQYRKVLNWSPFTYQQNYPKNYWFNKLV